MGRVLLALALVLGLLTAACGGDGGGAPAPPPDVTPTTGDDYGDEDYGY